MAYVDYTYYTQDFGGTAISTPEQFRYLELKAAAYVNKITFSRITEVTDDVKNAVCNVCDVLNTYASHDGIKSENNDGYSVTYKDDTQKESEIFRAAVLFLPSELLYRGVY